MNTFSSEIRKALDENNIRPAVGTTLVEIADFFTRIESYDRYINVDFDDFLSLIRESSVIGIASETVSYDNIGSALRSILATTVDGSKPSSVIVNFNIGPDFLMEHMQLVSEAVETLPSDVDMTWGMSHSNSDAREVEVAVAMGYK